MSDKNSVVMVGLGYIGLPTAALMASKGLKVLGVDIQQEVVDTINAGQIHIVEPDLEGLVKNQVERGNLVASTQPETADTYLIAVPTPFKGDHMPDLKYVEAATRTLLPHLKEGDLFIIESTSPVGTTEAMQKLVEAERPELAGKIYMAYCPERVLPGNVIHELENNDRVIGGINEASTEQAIAFYGKFVKGKAHPTNSRTAEMCKLVENSYRDVNIAFANELSLICREADIDVWELISLANRHPRVNILQPGPGVGGHCIAVDPWFIASQFPKQANIVRAAREINDAKPAWVVEEVLTATRSWKQENDGEPQITCFGLSYKPDIDDLRESPSVKIHQSLKALDLQVKVVEPYLVKNIGAFENLQLEEALKTTDIAVLLVPHTQLKAIDWGKRDFIVLDFCGMMR